jgi:hypothetical protein
LRLALDGMTTCVAFCQKGAQSIGVVGLVRDEPLNWAGGVQEFGGHDDIMDVARGKEKDAWAANRVGQRVDRGRAASARSPDRFFEDPPFRRLRNGAL